MTRHDNRSYAVGAVAACAAIVFVTTAGAGAGSDFDLTWHTIAGGGETYATGMAAEGEYTLGGTIGQHDAGAMSGGGYALTGGFWAGAGDLEMRRPCLGELDGDDAVNVQDLLVLLAAWGTNPGHDADLDGNDVVDVADLLELLSAWGPCS